MRTGCGCLGMMLTGLFGLLVGELASEWTVPFIDKGEAIRTGAQLAGRLCRTRDLPATTDCSHFTATLLVEQPDGWWFTYSNRDGVFRAVVYTSRRGRSLFTSMTITSR